MRTVNRLPVISAALFILLLTACSGASQEISTPKPEPGELVVSSSTSEPRSPAVPLVKSEPEASADPSPTTKSGILKRIVEKVSGVSPTAEPTVEPTPRPPDSHPTVAAPAVATTGPGKLPVPDPTPKSKTAVSTSSTFADLNVDSSGSGLDHLAAAERYRVLAPPESAAITVDHDPATGYVVVSAGEGAVPSDATVLIGNMELGNAAVVQADSKGAFGTRIAARAGTHLLLKQDSTAEGNAGFRGGIEKIFDSEQIGSPGIVLRVPIVRSTADPGGYSVAGGARVTDDGPPWIFEGILSDIVFQPGGTFDVSGQLKVLTDIQSLDGVSFRFQGQILGDETGYQIGPAGDFLSNILTPTGLPIERTQQENPLDIFSQSCVTGNMEWRKANDGLVVDVSCNVQVESDAPTGTYVTWLTLNTPDSVREAIQPSEKLLTLGNALGQGNSIALATVTVGPAEPLRLTTTLLADLLQEGTRGGVLAREDADRLAIGSRIITHHNPIVPRLDPYGDPWRHRLDPYLPLMGITDRKPPAVPLIAFDFSNSELKISVERPDGKTDVLGPGPFTAYGVKSGTTPRGNQIAGGGGHIGEIPQLLGAADIFEYQFPLDGDYVVHLAGHIADENGQILEVTGTFDLVVADSLDIETALLPGTPFEVGDSLPVALQVYPGVPADIRFTVTHIGADNAVTKKEYTGTANNSGWWDGEGQFFSFAAAGEYLVEAEARYPDSEERQWAGRMKYGSVVATPDGPIIAHGLRGHDAIDYIPPPWGFGADFPTDGHLQFPYFTGDVLWGMEGPEKARGDVSGLSHNLGSGPGDSVNVGLSMQIVDEDHPLVERALKQAEESMSAERYKDLLKAGQVPLITMPEETDPFNCGERCGRGPGGSLGIRPEELSLLAYTYGSAQRPGVRVRELIQGEGASSAYWRFTDAYHMQSGNGSEGDLPGDFKFMYGGTVIRDIDAQEGVFAIYGSGWVLTDDDDPMGSRFMPPFQGNAGGPTGGPLFTVHGREVDIFFLPLGVRPGAVLEVGDIFRMAGPIMPTLPSRVEYTVTAPDGSTRSLGGRGNSVGYFYDPQDDFELDKPGLWTVDLGVTHDGMTSAGPVQEPYPQGGPLTPDGSTFTFIVKDSDTLPLNLSTDLTMLRPTNWYGGANSRASFAAPVPQDWTGTTGHVTVTMPGIVLVDTEIPVENGSIIWQLDSGQMNQLARNFDSGELADTVTVTYHLEEQSGRTAVGTIVTHGNRVPRFLSTGLDKPVSLADLATNQTGCLENETQLFDSDFENGAPGWEIDRRGGWSIVLDGGSKALRGEGHVHAFADDNWGEVAWRLLVKLVRGGVHLNFHWRDSNRYMVSFREDGTGVIGMNNGQSDMGSSGIHHALGEWHVVEIGLQKDIFYVAVDGFLEIEQREPDPLPPGGIWLEVLDDSEVLFDEIRVCKPGA